MATTFCTTCGGGSGPYCAPEARCTCGPEIGREAAAQYLALRAERAELPSLQEIADMKPVPPLVETRAQVLELGKRTAIRNALREAREVREAKRRKALHTCENDRQTGVCLACELGEDIYSPDPAKRAATLYQGGALAQQSPTLMLKQAESAARLLGPFPFGSPGIGKSVSFMGETKVAAEPETAEEKAVARVLAAWHGESLCQADHHCDCGAETKALASLLVKNAATPQNGFVHVILTEAQFEMIKDLE